MRVVIDTNIWVSAFLTNRGHSARLIEAFRAGDFEVVVSEPLLYELYQSRSQSSLIARQALQRLPYPIPTH